MDISVAEISSIIKRQISEYDKQVEVQETGTVLTAGDGSYPASMTGEITPQ